MNSFNEYSNLMYEDISDAEDIGIGDGHNCMLEDSDFEDVDLVDEKCSENGNNDVDHKDDSSYDGDDEYSSGNETESDEDEESEDEDFKDKHSKDEDSKDEDSKDEESEDEYSDDDDSEDDHNDSDFLHFYYEEQGTCSQYYEKTYNPMECGYKRYEAKRLRLW
ncbi:PREDICTED: nucleolar transcription factor 1-like [Nicrophorus vespilloides]|uniref:Nucleolar transcription factor 1-like n=1 Tax=Nicrophorus vespilloides TaxID=110193 RepID=A0ABM1N611_NICVS|nr:PREDICTED: nucleolar transcription factor 1-like [Nicrophorus vespilloides]